MAEGVFAAAINCIDGRVQRPVTEWVKANAHADYVDTITSAGPDDLLTHATPERLATLRQMLEISVNAHGSRQVAIAGHYDCAAFPADREQHVRAIQSAITVIEGWGLPVHITGLWVNERWEVEVVATGGVASA